MKQIELTQGKVTLVSDHWYAELNKHKWHAHCAFGKYYAQRWSEGRTINMHRVIMGEPEGMMVDHRNGITLDNQESNLRKCTNSQNQMNSQKQRNNTSGYKGVTWSKHAKKWMASVCCKGHTYYLGYYFCVVRAAMAYDIKAKELHGKFARLNFEGSCREYDLTLTERKKDETR